MSWLSKNLDEYNFAENSEWMPNVYVTRLVSLAT